MSVFSQGKRYFTELSTPQQQKICSSLAVFAVKQVAHGLAARLVGLRHGLSIYGGQVLAGVLGFGFGFAAGGAAVGETRLIGLEFELFVTDDAGFDGEGHFIFKVNTD